MNITNIQDLSTEELIKQKKKLSIVTGALAGTIAVLLIVLIYLISQDGFTAVAMALLVIPISNATILFINFSQLNKINKELKSRNLY